MKFNSKKPLKENVYNFMRKIGYSFLGKDEKNNQFAFAKPLRGYPRFHLFLKQEGENLIFNLHLDQKKPVYKSAPAHAGEYESEIVEKEAERIKQML